VVAPEGCCQILLLPLQLCIQAAAAAALGLRASVAYIDTSNSFSAHRLAQIVTGLHGKDKFVVSRLS
jgi:hypothetical protein